MSWNHNTHYHGFVLRALPPNCQRALDVGCGRGALARKLAAHCEEVVGIDADSQCIAHVMASTEVLRNTTFINGDVLTHALQPNSFDFLAAVATLHHLPLRRALQRFSDLLRPGGVLVIVGLYRTVTPTDYAVAGDSSSNQLGDSITSRGRAGRSSDSGSRRDAEIHPGRNGFGLAGSSSSPAVLLSLHHCLEKTGKR
jgi:ubiquinone/menaquinone biosynthesis C-methylase UbiE